VTSYLIGKLCLVKEGFQKLFTQKIHQFHNIIGTRNSWSKTLVRRSPPPPHLFLLSTCSSSPATVLCRLF